MRRHYFGSGYAPVPPGIDTSSWLVITSAGGAVPFNLAAPALLATNPDVQTNQGTYAYDELPTLFGYAAPPSMPGSDGVPFMPGVLPQVSTGMGLGLTFGIAAGLFVLYKVVTS